MKLIKEAVEEVQFTPYTYLIGWKKLDKWYYGCQYGKNASPNNLWKTYFTSSKYVHQFREQYGDPDVIEIRKTFKSKEDAAKWEENVLIRLGASSSDRWLNMHNGGKNFTITEESKKKISEKNKVILKGKKKPLGFGEKISKAIKGRVPWNKGKILGSYSKERNLINSISQKNRKRIECPSCFKVIDVCNYKKYNHGYNCKQRRVAI